MLFLVLLIAVLLVFPDVFEVLLTVGALIALVIVIGLIGAFIAALLGA